MWHAFGERSLHCRLARVFERFDPSRRRKEIHVHVATAAEGRFEFLEHKKHFAVVSARFASRLDEQRPHYAVILPHGQVGAGSVVSVIKTEARRLWCEQDPSLAVRRDEWRTLLGGSVHITRHLL